MQAERLTRLVDSLLDMSRIQSGALEVRPVAQSVADLVHESLGQLHSALGERQVEVLVPDDLPLVDGDPVLIAQVLTNLIENANRFGPAGTPLTVSVSRGAAGRACIAVADQGTGVPASEREAVFERFVRFDSGGRSGLGLAIAKAFVEAHGERIWVEEANGGGARFVFTLPLALAPTPAA
jgi:two-component system, OmpR family, sensor histidine kinase KdpD